MQQPVSREPAPVSRKPSTSSANTNMFPALRKTTAPAPAFVENATQGSDQSTSSTPHDPSPAPDTPVAETSQDTPTSTPTPVPAAEAIVTDAAQPVISEATDAPDEGNPT